MSDHPFPTEQQTTDEHLDRFEDAWQSAESVPDIGDFLPPEGNSLRHKILLEFIKIDIEYHWRLAKNKDSEGNTLPYLEDYVNRFPELGTPVDLPVDLIAHEYRTRCWSGECPEHREYLERFPNVADEVADELHRFDNERSSLAAGAASSVGDRSTARNRKSTFPDQAGGSSGKRQTALPREFGDYEILDEIARGGMGVVYRARQRSLNRIVALKVIVWGALAGDEEIRRFRAEAESAAQLDHPNIVPIFEVGQHDTHHFFTMAFVDGLSLSERVVEGPLPPRDAARLIETIARAIQYAHDRGIVHRDIKPGNVLLALEPDRSIPSESDKAHGSSLSLDAPKITDFGLAKQLTADEQWTTPGLIIGTPGYMPPEQAEGRTEAVGPVSDVYSLGATLYCLLTGRPPFQAATPLETVKQVSTQEPVSPRQLNPAVDRDVETICLKCIEKSPARRYQSAAELAEDLNRYLNHQPIHARPILPIGRLTRWVRRNRLLTISATLIVLSLTAGLIGTLAGLREAQHQYEDASEQRDVAIEQRNRAIAAERDADAKRIRAEAAETRANAQTVIANNATRLANKRFDALKTEAFQTMFQRLDDADRLRNGAQLRRNLARQALEQLKRLAEDTGPSAEVSSALVDAYMRLAAVQGDTERLSLQRYSDAIESYQSALKILSDPALPEEISRVWERKARCWVGIGGALTQQLKIAQARSAFETAQRILKAQLQTDPENKLARTMLVEAFQGEGLLAFTSRKTAHQATRPFQNALREIDQLAAKGHADERTRIRQGSILFHIAVPIVVNRQFKEALKYFEESRDVLAKVARNAPANLRARADLIVTCLNMALIGRKDNPQGPWRDSMKTAIDTELSLVDLSVDSYLPVQLAAGQLQQMSTEMARIGEIELALQLGHKAVFLYEELTAFHPDKPTVRVQWANALTRLAMLVAGSGRHTEGYDLLYASQRTFLTAYQYDVEFEPIRAELMLKSAVLFLSAAMDGKNKKGEPVGWDFRQRQLRRAIDSIRTSRKINLTLREHLAKLKKTPPTYLQNTKFLARVLRELELARAEFDKKKEPGTAAQLRIMAYTFSILSTKLPAK